MSRRSDDIMAEIARRGLKPRPVWHFLARRSVFWALAAGSVLLGAMGTAVALFIVTDRWATAGRGFDEMPFDDVASAVPLLALALLALTAASGTLAFRGTRHGHRVRPAVVAVAVLALSLTTGTGLHLTGAGSALHRMLSNRFPVWAAMTAIPYTDWSQPDAGRLGGTALAVEDDTLHLRAFDGTEWAVDISAAEITFDEDPVEEGDVAITGTRTGNAVFRATRVEPFD